VVAIVKENRNIKETLELLANAATEKVFSLFYHFLQTQCQVSCGRLIALHFLAECRKRRQICRSAL